jgi:hypothetical protein
MDMALLRQCLQELREKRHDWSSFDAAWPASRPSHDDSRAQWHAEGQATPDARELHADPVPVQRLRD